MKAIILLVFALSAFGMTIAQKEFTLKKEVKSWIEFKNERLTRQNYDYSCGSAALATLLSHYYDANVTEEMILKSVLEVKGIDKQASELENQEGNNGLSFYDLSQYVSTQGFKAVGIALGMEELRKLQIPVIVFVKIRKQEHFTVLKKMDERYVYLADPSFGNIRVSHAKFKEMFFTREAEDKPGKILAVLAQGNAKGDEAFKAVVPFPNSIYERITNPLRR
ncbi:C39 family peptidase [Sulfuricurvum sp.]|uniref:C39 family peptidase n=1 Tax=Sulfuricurvum sp. TaxID=2025608 RepID=UPI003BB5D7AB